MNHGGYFLGQGSNRSYVDGAVAWFDHVDSLTWSPRMLENLVEDLGYEMQGRMTVYYCIPILSIASNGLRKLVDLVDTRAMVDLVGCGQNFISVYLDHDQSMRAVDWDDVVDYPIADLPPIISPLKPTSTADDAATNLDDEPVPLQIVQPEEGVRTRSNVRVEMNIDQEEGMRTRSKARLEMSTDQEGDESSREQADNSEDDDSEFGIVDSDYAISEEDDDLYAEHVDDDEDKAKKMRMKGKEKVEGDGDSEGEDLWGPESDEDNIQLKFKTFRTEDLSAPKFKIGLIFESVDMLRKAIKEYACQERRDVRLPINDLKRIKAVCKGSKTCPWYMWASYDSRPKTWMIKRYEEKHTCARKWNIRQFRADFVADNFLPSFKADQDMSLKNFGRVVQKDWNMTPGTNKLQRARRIAMKKIYGDEEAQYKMMWDYGNEIRSSNPGSSFFLALDEFSRFKRCYMSLEACKRGFLGGCRPIIFIDGCHLKTRYRGQLLCAVGIDPNDCIFPIAIAAVEVEDTDSWSWFLQTLKTDLDIVNTRPWTIMSDKQKGLINAVREEFPESEHRFCVRHLWQNFQQLFRGDALKNQLWIIARSSTVVRYERAMEHMKALNPAAFDWLDALDPKTWVRAFQSDIPKCDILLNNNCEVFNKYILDARELPCLAMLIKIKDQLMTRHYNKRKEANGWPGPLCPKIQKKLDKHIEWSNNSFVEGSGDGLFKVGEILNSTPTDYIVDLSHQTCTCKRWEKSGIPCPHAISCMRAEDWNPAEHVHKCYSVERYKATYAHIVCPCKDKTEWAKMNGPPILPPEYKKHVGRPTRCRRKAPGEVDARGGGKRMSRHGVIMHCSYCGEPDHNINGCTWKKAGLPDPRTTSVPPPPPPDAEPVITQEPEDNTVNATIVDDLVADRMTQERTVPRQSTTGPIPDSTFLADARASLNQPQVRTTLSQGELAGNASKEK